MGLLATVLKASILALILAFAITHEAFGNTSGFVQASGEGQPGSLPVIENVRLATSTPLGMVFGEGAFRPGLKIVYIWPGSPAARAGLQTGDTLYMIDGARVTSIPGYLVAIGHITPTSIFSFISKEGSPFTVTFVP